MIADPDGAGYERYMGYWSQLVGRAFLNWLAAPAGANCVKGRVR